MKQNHSKPIAAIVRVLLFSTGMILSCNGFADDRGRHILDGEIGERIRNDRKLQSQIDLLNTRYAIGDAGPAGGIVFYVTALGYHGLEAAPENTRSKTTWGCYGTFITGADGTAVGTGAQNTKDIIDADCRGYAAGYADNYAHHGYTDWYLPARDTLKMMYRNIGPGAPGSLRNKGDFSRGMYWSSTRASYNRTYVTGFRYGRLTEPSRRDYSLYVRPVRTF